MPGYDAAYAKAAVRSARSQPNWMRRLLPIYGATMVAAKAAEGFEEEEEKHMSWYYDQFHDKIIIFEKTDVYGSDRYWHFVCELK